MCNSSYFFNAQPGSTGSLYHNKLKLTDIDSFFGAFPEALEFRVVSGDVSYSIKSRSHVNK